MLLWFYTGALLVTVLLGASAAQRVLGDHRRTQLVMSFVSGLMLGVAVFHLMPHALYLDRSAAAVDNAALWLMIGLLSMFLLQRLFHFHQHESVAECEAHDHDHEPLHVPAGQFGGAGVLFGLSVHALLDGVALAASMRVDWGSTGASIWPPAGIGVFLAILLHKPLDAMTIALFARRSGHSAAIRWLMLAGYALLCPVTAALLLYGLPGDVLSNPGIVAAALSFSAGLFLCIALSDLLPELHFHDHDRLSMTAALLLGILLAWSLKHAEIMHGDHDAHDSEVALQIIQPLAGEHRTHRV